MLSGISLADYYFLRASSRRPPATLDRVFQCWNTSRPNGRFESSFNTRLLEYNDLKLFKKIGKSYFTTIL